MTTSGGEKFTGHINAISFLSGITWCYKLLQYQPNLRNSLRLVVLYSQQMRSQYCFPYPTKKCLSLPAFYIALAQYKSLSKSLPSICITSVKLSAPLQALQYQYLSTLQNAVCAKVQCSIRCNTRCKSTYWKRSLCFEVQFVHNDNAIHCPEQVQQSSVP